jgi:hypothetical protein
LNFLQKATIDLSEYEEIYDALITLKVLKTIREYKLISSKNIKLNKIKYREEHMEGIMKALLYLMLKLSDNIVEDIHFDSRLIADLIFHNFMFKIAQDESEKNVTFFFEYFTNLIDKTIENSEKNFTKQKKFEVLKKYFSYKLLVLKKIEFIPITNTLMLKILSTRALALRTLKKYTRLSRKISNIVTVYTN